MKKLLLIIVLIAGCNATFNQKPSKYSPVVVEEPQIPVEIKRDIPPFKRTYDGEIIVIDRKLHYIWPDGKVEVIK